MLSSGLEKAQTAIWFACRRSHWRHALELGRRKFLANRDGGVFSGPASAWAAERVTGVVEALVKVGLIENETVSVPEMPESVLTKAKRSVQGSCVEMGGPGDLKLIYAATVLSGACKAVETGVAYGWSSLAMLTALGDRKGSGLISVDMPYPKRNNEAYVGTVVPARLRRRWELIREPDRNGLRKAISKLGGVIDICHYDSDKSYHGRTFAYPILWNALGEGGVFISDDIQDNLAFEEFVDKKSAPYAVTAYQGKYVGIVRKC